MPVQRLRFQAHYLSTNLHCPPRCLREWAGSQNGKGDFSDPPPTKRLRRWWRKSCVTLALSLSVCVCQGAAANALSVFPDADGRRQQAPRITRCPSGFSTGAAGQCPASTQSRITRLASNCPVTSRPLLALARLLLPPEGASAHTHQEIRPPITGKSSKKEKKETI